MIGPGYLPDALQLDGLLGLSFGGGVDDLLERALLGPLEEFLARPSKQLRGQLVSLGYRLAGNREPDASDRKHCVRAAETLEAIHAASLVVDDIQDGSLMRRGRPTLHRSHGVPLALNAGNWLYFWPLEKVRDWGLEEKRELGVYRVCHRSLLRAHFGQAIDVGTPVDALPKERVFAVSLASLELKTGALTAMALSLGAVLAGASAERVDELSDFGQRFGVALQMFDDIGNLRDTQGKRFEDLLLRRPSWVWAVAAKELDAEAYAAFVSAVRALPETAPLEAYLAASPLEARARTEAERHLAAALERLRSTSSSSSFSPVSPDEASRAELHAMGERLKKAYG